MSYTTIIPDEDQIKVEAGQDFWLNSLLSAEELCSKEREDDFKNAPVIIEGMLAQGDLSLITAGSKSFKSWLALQIAITTANGIPFLGRQTLPTKTLVLNFELKPSSIRNRLKGIARRLSSLRASGGNCHSFEQVSI